MQRYPQNALLIISEMIFSSKKCFYVWVWQLPLPLQTFLISGTTYWLSLKFFPLLNRIFKNYYGEYCKVLLSWQTRPLISFLLKYVILKSIFSFFHVSFRKKGKISIFMSNQSRIYVLSICRYYSIAILCPYIQLCVKYAFQKKDWRKI